MKVLLFSGGLDSTAIAWMERPEILLFIDYGQVPAAGERRAASALAEAIKLPLDIRRVPMSDFGSGALAGGTPLSDSAPEFWPLRNQMLVTLAVMAYANHQQLEIVIGTVAGDAVHPDGNVPFIDGMNAALAAQGDFRLRAPAIGMNAATLLEISSLPDEVLGWTFSCHTGEWACGQCRGCHKHAEITRHRLQPER